MKKKIIIVLLFSILMLHTIVAQEVFNSISIGGTAEFSNPQMYGGVITSESVFMQNKDINLDFSLDSFFKIGSGHYEESFQGSDKKESQSGLFIGCGAYFVFNKGLIDSLGLRIGFGCEVAIYSGESKSEFGALGGGLIGIELFPKHTFSFVLDTMPSFSGKSKDWEFDLPVSLSLRFNFRNLMPKETEYSDNVDYLLEK